jgi:hypothetical protein
MDIKKFVQIVSSFADSELDVDYEKGKLTAQIRDEIFEEVTLLMSSRIPRMQNQSRLMTLSHP